MKWREYNDVVTTVMLSASGSGDRDPDDHCDFNDCDEPSPSTYKNDLYETSEEVDADLLSDRPIYDNIHPVYYSDSEEETEAVWIHLEKREKNERKMH